MKILMPAIFVILVITVVFKIINLKNVKYKEPKFLTNKKVLTVYYSDLGNTRKVAQNLHSVVGGDIKEIKLIDKYPENIFEKSNLVRKQAKEGILPKIEDIDFSDYDVIFAGSPIWGLGVSLPVQSFLKNNDFEDKILIPFFTYSGGANRNKVFNNIKNYANAKEIKKPLFIFENGFFLTKECVINWLNRI